MHIKLLTNVSFELCDIAYMCNVLSIIIYLPCLELIMGAEYILQPKCYCDLITLI